jgi:hypothetical protein
MTKSPGQRTEPPSEEPDPAKYVIGGCLVSEDMPDYKCITCSADFYKTQRNTTIDSSQMALELISNAQTVKNGFQQLVAQKTTIANFPNG